MPHSILRIIYSLNILENISREHVRKSTPLWCQFTILSMFSHRLLPFLNKIASFYLTPSRFVDCRWKKERWMGRFTYSITHLQMKNDWWHLIKPLFLFRNEKNQRYEGISFFLRHRKFDWKPVLCTLFSAQCTQTRLIQANDIRYPRVSILLTLGSQTI